MKSIMIAGDQPIFRVGTRIIIQKQIKNAIIAEVDTLKKAIQLANAKRFDLLILDISLPDANSVSKIVLFKSRWPSLRILILSDYPENLYALPFIKAGADGYLSKSAPEQELRDALHTILVLNKLYMSQAVQEESLLMLFKFGRSQDNVVGTLSIREREIVQLILAGKGVSEIGLMLHLHTSTVSTHRARIFRKMGVDNSMDLARRYALMN